MTDEPQQPDKRSTTPSMLDLVRLSPRAIFPPGGRELYRQIALLTDMKEGDEVLVAACGAGVTLEYFVSEYGVQGSGADVDAHLIERAESRTRDEGLHGRLQFQQSAMASLPYRDGVFDVVVAELGLTAHADPDEAIAELVRVVRPGGHVVLVQLVWKAPVEPERQAVLAEHLGARPLMLVELKRILRSHGLERMHTEAWSDEETAFRPQVKKPFPDFAELFSVSEKLGILRRAFRRWGWSGVKSALARELTVHRLLEKERILGLDMIKATKPGTAEAASSNPDDVADPGEEGEAGDLRGAGPSPGAQAPPQTSDQKTSGETNSPDPAPADELDEALKDLPLFQNGGGER